jgi:DNA-binding MarR family transcriptional regulator
MTDKLPSLDPMLHQPVRTQIMAFLSGRGDTSFTDLKRALEVTDGNLGAHLGKLVEAGLVNSADALAGNRSQTLFRLTTAGRAALGHYVAHLEALMKMVTPQAGTAAVAHRPLRTRTR